MRAVFASRPVLLPRADVVAGFVAVFAAAAVLTASFNARAATSAKNIFKNVAPSIVVVEVQTRTGARGQGSGVVVGPNEVVTNYHVVKGAARITVHKVIVGTGRHQALRARRTTACNQKWDLCLLAVSGLSVSPAAPVARLGKAKTLSPGETVYAIGAPKGLSLSITRGIVSQLRGAHGREAAPKVQTDTPISPGSSGGGLFNEDGELVGITTEGIRGTGEEGLNFAMPVELVAELQARQSPSRQSTATSSSFVPPSATNRPSGTSPKAKAGSGTTTGPVPKTASVPGSITGDEGSAPRQAAADSDCDEETPRPDLSGALTREEKIARLDKAFQESLGRFQRCQTRSPTSASATESGASSGSGAGGGSAGDGSQGAGGGSAGDGSQGAGDTDSASQSPGQTGGGQTESVKSSVTGTEAAPDSAPDSAQGSGGQGDVASAPSGSVAGTEAAPDSAPDSAQSSGGQGDVASVPSRSVTGTEAAPDSAPDSAQGSGGQGDVASAPSGSVAGTEAAPDSAPDSAQSSGGQGDVASVPSRSVTGTEVAPDSAQSSGGQGDVASVPSRSVTGTEVAPDSAQGSGGQQSGTPSGVDPEAAPEGYPETDAIVADTANPDQPKLGNGKAPDDIPPADNDSIVAAQIRAAALAEKDPQVQARLWNEYRKIKGFPVKNEH